MIGTVLDRRYRVLRQLGAGGMGEVYLVEHVNLGRQEALKVLHAHLAGDPVFASRFRREARAMNRLQHPGIVAVYDFGQLPDGRYYLCMELADGERLDALLGRTGPLSPRHTLGVLAQLAEAAAHAHSRGVIHRDLKPQNVVLCAAGPGPGKATRVKVLDFGIAKIIAPGYRDSQASREGQAFGTPEYMAPEQFDGAAADPRSDVYAIGCIGFELLVGQPPFTGSALEVMNGHRDQEPGRPGLRRRPNDVPPELDALLMRCLEKAPERRFASARDLSAAIDALFGRRPAQPTTARGDYEPAEITQTTPDPMLYKLRGEVTGVGMADTLAAPTEGGDDGALWLQAAEALLDAMAAPDIQLVLDVANAKEQSSQLARAVADASALEARAADLEQAAREREASLRFALGELNFRHSRAAARGEPEEARLAGQIAELERRLSGVSAELAQELAALTERGVAIAARRAQLEDSLARTLAGLRRLVTDNLPAHAGHPAIAPLAARLGARRP